MTDISMLNLSSREVGVGESARLGVKAGWYTHKISGTFVSGPHGTKDEAQQKVLELNPPTVKRKG